MSESASGEADASTESADKSVCPTCGDTFGSTSGMKSHHTLVHGESIAGVEVECDNCGETYTDYPSEIEAYDNNYCSMECRDEGESSACEYPRLADVEWMRKQYMEHDKSGAEIAEMVGCAQHTAYRWLGNHDLRKNPDTSNRYPELSDREQLCEWYVEEGLYLSEIAERVGCHRSAVGKALKRFGMETHYPTQEDHPNWRGGHPEYYGPNWKDARDECRERDGYTCQSCGLAESEIDRQLDVHHKTPVSHFKAEYDAPEWWQKANQINNLVTLCNNCHMTWEYIPVTPQFGSP